MLKGKIKKINKSPSLFILKKKVKVKYSPILYIGYALKYYFK
jgi:hypothetical protein